jgi:DNA topoisomerase-3
MQKKNIRCTSKGKYLIETLPVKELMDLEYTGRLEKTLHDIEKGDVLKDAFLEHIKAFVCNAVRDIKVQRAPILKTINDETKTLAPSNKAKTLKKAQSDDKSREILGKCPECGQTIVEGKKGFGCMGYKEGCRFVIWQDNDELEKYGKKVTKVLVKALLKKGEAELKNVTSAGGQKVNLILKNIKGDNETGYKLIITEQNITT